MASGLEGTLTGTLPKTPEEVLAAMEAFRAVQANALALQREQATNAAGQAAEQYAGLAQAPPPDIAPLAMLLNTLQGNVSSVLSGDRSFQDRAQQRTQQSRAQLLQSRVENLRALRDIAQQKAEEASRLGNLEEQEKARKQMATLDKQFDLVSANQKRAQQLEDKEAERAFTAEQNRLDRASAERRAGPASQGVGANGAVDPAVASFAGQVQRGEIEFAGVPAKYKPSVSQHMTENQMQIVPKKVRDTLLEISTGRAALNQLKQLSARINTASWRGRIQRGARLTAEGAAQKNKDVARYNALRKGLLAALSRATGERGVLTNQDVGRARELLPSVWTAKEVAEGKWTDLEGFFNEKETMARGTYYSTGQGTAAGQPQATHRFDPTTGQIVPVGP